MECNSNHVGSDDISWQVNPMLEPNTWYEINDQELFLFATNGFWDGAEKMEVYRRVKARKIENRQGKDGE